MHRISLDDAPQVVLGAEFLAEAPRDPVCPVPRFRLRIRTSYDSGVILNISDPGRSNSSPPRRRDAHPATRLPGQPPLNPPQGRQAPQAHAAPPHTPCLPRNLNNTCSPRTLL